MKIFSAPNCLKRLINTKKHMCLFPLKEYLVILILIPASRTRGPEKDNNVLELFFIVWYQTTVISINVTIFCNYVLRSLQIPSVTSRISGGWLWISAIRTAGSWGWSLNRRNEIVCIAHLLLYKIMIHSGSGSGSGLGKNMRIRIRNPEINPLIWL